MSLRDMKQRIRPLFRQERVARNAGLFLECVPETSNWLDANESAGDLLGGGDREMIARRSR
jgi:hypothetical protein